MKKLSTIILYIVLFTTSIVWIYPYVWMLLSSFKPTNEIYGGFLPSQFTFENYKFILEAADKMERPFIQALGNSIFISVTVTLGVLVTSALVGFGLSRLSFKGRNAVFNFIIFQMIFPGFLFIVPLYVLIRNLGLIDTRTALILPSLVSAWGIFMFTQSFRAVPNEYLEAARMDGANDLWIITRVLVPLASSTVSIVGLFTFIGIWDNFMWPLIVVSDYTKMPLSVLLASFNMQYGSYLGPVLAGSVLQTMPMVVIFLVFRKYFLQGISMSLK